MIRLPVLIFCLGSLQGLSQDSEPAGRTDWLVAFDLLLPANPVIPTETSESDAGVDILKLCNTRKGPRLKSTFSLSDKLWRVAVSGVWPAFSDPELSQPLTPERLQQRFQIPDTSMTIDPATLQEKIRFSWSAARAPADAPYVNVRQLLRYDEFLATFSLESVAIGPCWEDDQVAYWLKIPPCNLITTAPLEAIADITWAVIYTTDSESPDRQQFAAPEDNQLNVLQRFIWDVRRDTTIEIYSAADSLLTGEPRRAVFSRMDSVTLFDPQTWKEYVQPVQRGLDFEEVQDLQLTEEWAWDEAEPRTEVREPGTATQLLAPFFRKCTEPGGD
jgi:hypothetical protein